MSERRHAVPFDPDYFGRRLAAGECLEASETFRHIWRTNHWHGRESVSGAGSGSDQTATLVSALPTLLGRHGIRSLLDAPCGDWRWMTRVPLGSIAYTGGELLRELVDENTRRHGGPGRRFLQLDLTSSTLPAADLLLCRDCLVHLSFADIGRVLDNVARSAIGWFLATTFPAEPRNIDIVTGDWRPLNLELPPFNLPPPVELLNERCTEGHGAFDDKSLGLWRTADLRRPADRRSTEDFTKPG